MKKKLIIVASYLGRTGSSALMGTLSKCGFNLGIHLKPNPDINNPKGYFELKSQDTLIASVFPEFYQPRMTQGAMPDRAPYSAQDLDKIFSKSYTKLPDFYKFIRAEFIDDRPIAIKDIRLLLLPFVYGARKDFDVRVIMLNRSVHGRAMSALQMRHNMGMDLAKVDRQELVSYIQSWKNFGEEIKKWMPEIPIMDLRFESLMLDTKHAIGAISEFIDVPRLELLKASGFIDPNLARRKTLENPYLNVCYGQNSEDHILRSLFPTLGYRGTYIDVGSLDGRVFSNTYTFELADWNGICVEAHPAFIPQLQKNRPGAVVFHAAAMAKDQEHVTFHAYPRGSLSTLREDEVDYLRKRFKAPGSWEKVTVPGRCLNSMLFEASITTPIDVVSIDVEGAELGVLQGFDLEKYRPRIMVLEHLTPAKKQEVAAYVQPFGYIGAADLSNNTFYCKKENVQTVVQARKSLRAVPITTTHPLDRK